MGDTDTQPLLNHVDGQSGGVVSDAKLQLSKAARAHGANWKFVKNLFAIGCIVFRGWSWETFLIAQLLVWAILEQV